ncbi:MAG TPA: prepilin-type N-terminal cleavage/methylation domain-containing protein [Desulfobacteraceae bacterium]|nr:prepilin-type N-terminal cleavage/methylation domain-containing protein [Desulfobacteraceae bacterium]
MGNFPGKGFTLIEVMVALSMVAVALTAVLGSQSQGVSLAAEARFSTTASLLANSILARYETMDPRDLIDGSGDFGDEFPGYVWQASLERPYFDDPPNVADHLRRVEIVVTREGVVGLSYTLWRYLYLPE